MISIKELHWLAGILEGEGCFHSNHGRRHQAKITLSMTDEDVVRRVAKIFNNTVTMKPPSNQGNRMVFAVAKTSAPAAAWMMTLYPLLGNRRRAKIREILTAWRAGPRRLARGKGRAALCHPTELWYASGLCFSCYSKKMYHKYRTQGRLKRDQGNLTLKQRFQKILYRVLET